MTVVDTIFLIVKIWLYTGAAVAAIFLTIGIDRIDEDARGAYVFRPLMVPACLLIWPLVLWRWYVLETGRDQWPKRHKPPREAHFWVAIGFAVLIPLIMIAGLLLRPVWPGDFEPQKLSQEQSSLQHGEIR